MISGLGLMQARAESSHILWRSLPKSYKPSKGTIHWGTGACSARIEGHWSIEEEVGSHLWDMTAHGAKHTPILYGHTWAYIDSLLRSTA